MLFSSDELKEFLQQHPYLEEEEVYGVLCFVIENLLTHAGRSVIARVNGGGKPEIVDLSTEKPVKRSPGWIFSQISYDTLKKAFIKQLDRYCREKVYSTYIPFKKRILSAVVVGNTYHLGRYSATTVNLPSGYTGSIRDFGEYLQMVTGIRRVYVESGKEEIRIEKGRHYLWDIADTLYKQSGYVMSINPHKKNLRIKKQNRSVLFDLGGIHAIMPSEETIPGEEYNPGDRYEVILYNVSQMGLEGYHLYVSRRQIEFVIQALLREFPEINRKDIKSVTRLPGRISAVMLSGKKFLKARAERLESVKKTIGDEEVLLVFNNGGFRNVLRQLFPFHEGDFVINHNTGHVIIVTQKKGTVIGRQGLNVKIAGMLTGYRFTVYTPDEYMAYLNRLQQLRDRYSSELNVQT
jgi:transcription antitermination factor NusA-like protein